METSFKTEGKMELKMLLLKKLGIYIKTEALQDACDVRFLYHLITTMVSFDLIDVLQIKDANIEIKKAIVIPIAPILQNEGVQVNKVVVIPLVPVLKCVAAFTTPI